MKKIETNGESQRREMKLTEKRILLQWRYHIYWDIIENQAKSMTAMKPKEIQWNSIERKKIKQQGQKARM